MRISAAVAITVLLSVSAGAESSGTARGQALFDATCAACHGRDGRGRAGIGREDGPLKRNRDFTAPRIQAMPDDQLVGIITQGMTRFPGYRNEHAVSTAAARDIVSYIRRLSSGPVSAAAAAPLERGEEVYLKACGPCHGRTGEGIFTVTAAAAPPSPEDTGTVDLRGGEGTGQPPRRRMREPIRVIRVDEKSFSAAELEVLKKNLRTMEERRHGFQLDENLSDADVRALGRYLDRLERKQFPPK
ncbi:MAG: c-type cytochrome [Elusimicrobiota bacterium]